MHNGSKKTMNKIYAKKDIIKIYIDITNNGENIDYIVHTRDGKTECYNKYTAPYSIIHIINYSQPLYHEKDIKNDYEKFMYGYIQGK